MYGGITGDTSTVSYSYNTGTINGYYQKGGISGNTYGLGDRVIYHCYNIGEIIVKSDFDRAGSIVGQGSNSTCVSCWWTSELDCTGFGGDYSYSKKITEEQLKGYVNNLGAEYFTADTTGINNGFPILKWELNRK